MHIPRERNRVVDYFAKWASEHVGVCKIEDRMQVSHELRQDFDWLLKEDLRILENS